MSFIKSVLLFIVYYILFLGLLIGMKLVLNINYIDGIPYYWIPTLISVFIFSIIYLSPVKEGQNRPRAAFGLGFVWLILTGVCDYVFLVDNFRFLSNIIPELDGVANDIVLMFDSIPIEDFYQKFISSLIIRYAIILLAPFFISLFMPKPEYNVPMNVNKNNENK